MKCSINLKATTPDLNSPLRKQEKEFKQFLNTNRSESVY
jgi:hypothetical protein